MSYEESLLDPKGLHWTRIKDPPQECTKSLCPPQTFRATVRRSRASFDQCHMASSLSCGAAIHLSLSSSDIPPHRSPISFMSHVDLWCDRNFFHLHVAGGRRLMSRGRGIRFGGRGTVLVGPAE